MLYGGLEKEKKGEEGTTTYNATFRVEWEKAQEAKFRDKFSPPAKWSASARIRSHFSKVSTPRGLYASQRTVE